MAQGPAGRRRRSGGRKSSQTQLLVRHAFGLARSLRVGTVLVMADGLRGARAVEDVRGSERLVWLTSEPGPDGGRSRRNDRVIHIPDTPLTRLSQIYLGLFLAVVTGKVGVDETVICISGMAGRQRLDTLLVATPRRDLPWTRNLGDQASRGLLASHTVARVIGIALRLASEGREGRPIGTIFVVGEMQDLGPYLRQLVLNPFGGHGRRLRDIHKNELVETLREYAAMDGAFVITPRGVIETAGTYLDAPVKRVKMRPGLGARHAAAAAITACTRALSVVVSESSGAVTVYNQGLPILDLQQPATPGRTGL